MTPSEEILFAEAVLGKEAEEFLASQVGRYLVGRAEQEEREALNLLATVSPWRRNRIRQLQCDVAVARSIKGWLAEMITAGNAAMHQLELSQE